MINWIVNIIGPENSFEVFSFILTYVFYLVGTFLFLYKRKHKNKFFLRIIPAIALGFPFAFGLALLNKTATGTGNMKSIITCTYLGSNSMPRSTTCISTKSHR